MKQYLAAAYDRTNGGNHGLPLQGQIQAPCQQRCSNTEHRFDGALSSTRTPPVQQLTPTNRSPESADRQIDPRKQAPGCTADSHIEVGLQDASPCSSPDLTNEGSAVTAQPHSNATGSRHPTRHQPERCAARHGQCRTVRGRREAAVRSRSGDHVDEVDPGEVDAEYQRCSVGGERGDVTTGLFDRGAGRDRPAVFQFDPEPVHPVHRVLARQLGLRGQQRWLQLGPVLGELDVSGQVDVEVFRCQTEEQLDGILERQHRGRRQGLWLVGLADPLLVDEPDEGQSLDSERVEGLSQQISRW